MLPRAPLLALLVAVTVFTGCSTPEGVGEGEAAIMGGAADSADTSVVGIYDLKLNTICSGSLIAPNVILTARHCVAPVLNTDPSGGILCGQTTFGAAYTPDHFVVTTREDIFDTSADRHVSEVITPPDAGFCGNDEAILILSSNILPPEAKALIPRVDEALSPMEGYSAIGYGAIDDSPGGTGAGTRRRRDGLFVSCVSDGCPKVFNKPPVSTTEWLGDQGVCHGDSGGPSVDSAGRVVGVTSRGGAACTTPVYGYVLGWAQWIKDATVHGASLAGSDPPPWATGWPTSPEYSYPVGAPCKKPGDCASGYCVGDAVGSYCTRACDETAPCEPGYTCDATSSQLCVAVRAPVKKPVVKPKSSGCSVAPGGGGESGSLLPWALLALALQWTRRRSTTPPRGACRDTSRSRRASSPASAWG